MTSKKYGWQKRWTVDRAAGTASHETGLAVRVSGQALIATDEEQVRQQLAVKHGHNAAEMVQRLLKEARILLVQP